MGSCLDTRKDADSKNDCEMDVSLVLCEHRCGQDQGPALEGVLGPERIARWRSLQLHNAALWMGLLLVGTVYLWDPVIDGASQTGLSKALLFTSTSELQPGLSSSSFS